MNKRKIKFGIREKTLSFVILPCILIGLFAAIYAAKSYRTIIEDEIHEQLRSASYGATNISQIVDDDIEKLAELVDIYSDEIGVDLTIFEGDIRVVSSIDGAIGTQMAEDIEKTLVDTKKDLFTTNANVNGEAYFGYYIPFVVDGKLAGSVFAGMPQKDANEIISSNVSSMVGIIVVIVIIVAIVSAIMISGLLRKLVNSVRLVEQLHGNDLAVSYNDRFAKNKDEYEEIYNSTYEFASNLNGIITNIRNASTDLHEISEDLNSNASVANETTDEITRAVESVASGAQDQAEDTQNVVDTISVMGGHIENIMENTGVLSETAIKMNEAKEKVVDALDVLSVTNNATISDVNDVNKQIELTNESIEAIFVALKLIQDIASQTNLLSFNASIEAARAGDVGKGFAVVADEIKTLANQSAESSQEIGQNLNALVDNYKLMVRKMEQATDNINEQTEKLMETKDNFVVLENGIEETNKQIELINELVESLDRERDVISGVVLNLSAISEENAASVEEITASIEELNSIVTLVDDKAKNLIQLSEHLQDRVSIFSV